MAAHTSLEDGRSEVGPWVHRRERVEPRMQVHVMLFDAGEGRTDVYAHKEFSSALKWVWHGANVL